MLLADARACLQRMVKQTAAAQRRTEAEARKAAKAMAGATAAGSGHLALDSSQAAVVVAAEPQDGRGAAKQAMAASSTALPQTGKHALLVCGFCPFAADVQAMNSLQCVFAHSKIASC